MCPKKSLCVHALFSRGNTDLGFCKWSSRSDARTNPPEGLQDAFDGNYCQKPGIQLQVWQFSPSACARAVGEARDRLRGAIRRRNARAVHEASEPPTKRAVVGEACAPRQGRPRRTLGPSLMMRPRAQRRLPGGSLRSLQDMSREAYATGGVPSKLPKMASIMTRASIGSSETPTTRRAGTQPEKNSA